VRTQLTVIQDLFTRCITGLRATPVSTKAVDVAGVLYQAIVPRPAPEDWLEEACWAYHGVPQQLVFTEAGRLPGTPVCPPETLVVDHGKAFVSAHVISVCTRLGISIQPAQDLAQMVVAIFEVGDERGQQGLALPDPVIDPLFGAPFLHRDAAQGVVRDRARRHPRRPPFRFFDRPAVQVEVEGPHRPQDLLGLVPLAWPFSRVLSASRHCS
jgi:hypothetical protein